MTPNPDYWPPATAGADNYAQPSREPVFGPLRAPPEQTVRMAAELRHWVKLAVAGERVRYATGYVLAQACSPTLREYVMALAEKGFITPHRMRGTDGVPVYIVQRTRMAIIEGQL